MKKKVLILCAGNTARIAEGILRQDSDERFEGRARVSIQDRSQVSLALHSNNVLRVLLTVAPILLTICRHGWEVS